MKTINKKLLVSIVLSLILFSIIPIRAEFSTWPEWIGYIKACLIILGFCTSVAIVMVGGFYFFVWLTSDMTIKDMFSPPPSSLQ